jgi:hypothetical protein
MAGLVPAIHGFLAGISRRHPPVKPEDDVVQE